ncbi:MAG: hypothetical protein WCX97_05055 [Candidatus Magasanikbacteria bacterium]
MQNQSHARKNISMSQINIINLATDIVKKACELKNKFTDAIDAPVNYACVFSQSDDEYDELKKLTGKIGKVIEQTPSGPLYHVNPIETVSGQLKLLKIRHPDVAKPERGDADFTINNYHDFKDKYLQQERFKLIPRVNFEMIELMDSDFNIRVYFSYPPLDKQLGIN